MFERQIKFKFLTLLESFRCVGLCGARQVGKSFFLKQLCQQSGWVYITLDDPLIRHAIAADPLHWIRAHRQRGIPLVIDEAAKSPEIFQTVKVIVDEEDPTPTKIVLASSSNYLLLRQIKESLAGRVGLLYLYPLTWREILHRSSTSRLQQFMQRDEQILKTQKFNTLELDRSRKEILLHGGFPELNVRNDPFFTRQWASQYFATYMLPLAVELFQVHKQASFEQLFRQIGLRTSQLINFSELGRDTAISSVTTKTHLHYLEAMMLVRELPQFFYNRLQRLVKSPKIHSLDPIFTTVNFAVPNSLDALDRAKITGALYESWIYAELLKSIEYESHFVELSTWHTQDDAEVDIILTQGIDHIPIEIKYKRKLSARDTSGIKAWMLKHDAQTPVAYIIYCGDQVVQLGEKIWGLPDHYFLGCS